MIAYELISQFKWIYMVGSLIGISIVWVIHFFIPFRMSWQGCCPPTWLRELQLGWEWSHKGQSSDLKLLLYSRTGVRYKRSNTNTYARTQKILREMLFFLLNVNLFCAHIFHSFTLYVDIIRKKKLLFDYIKINQS